MWHRVAPALAQHFTLVIADLPGYGWSAAPDGAGRSCALHQARHGRRRWSKRWRRSDLSVSASPATTAAGASAIGSRSIIPAGLSSLPCSTSSRTWDMWHRMDARLAARAWHWMFLALPAPFPETLIGNDPQILLRLACRGGRQGQSARYLRSARARALSCRLPGPAPHPRHVRGLSRRPHHRS